MTKIDNELDCSRTGEIREIIKTLESSAEWLILAHEKPDGDTLGCTAALARIAVRLGKKVTVGCIDGIPDRYRFIFDGIDYRILTSVPPLPEGSAIICLDTSNLARTVPGLAESKSLNTVINIDHHGDNGFYAHINWVEESASATGELVTRLALASGWGLEQDEATALYVALVSDNGNFRFAATSNTSHECAISLLEAGASPSFVAENLEVNLSKEVLDLWGRAFLRVEIFGGGRCALFWLDHDDFEESGTSRQDTENLVNYLLRIKGVRIAALCSGTEDGVRASLRTRPPFNARAIAAAFGGGGHELAAGCTIVHPVEEAVSLMRAEMERHADAGASGSQ